MTKKYAIFQLTGGYDLEPAKGFDVDEHWLPDVRFDSEQEALDAIPYCHELAENTEFVILAVYNV